MLNLQTAELAQIEKLIKILNKVILKYDNIMI